MLKQFCTFFPETIPVSEHSHDVDPESPHLEPCDVTSATPVILMSPPAEVPMSAMAGLHPAAQKRLFRYPKLDGWVFPYTLVANESDQSHDGKWWSQKIFGHGI